MSSGMNPGMNNGMNSYTSNDMNIRIQFFQNYPSSLIKIFVTWEAFKQDRMYISIIRES